MRPYSESWPRWVRKEAGITQAVPYSDAEKIREEGSRMAVLLLRDGDPDARQQASEFLLRYGKADLERAA